MKRLILIIIALMLPALAGCANTTAPAEAADDGRIKVVTTIFPPYDFAREVAGDMASITLLLPPGTESHSYEPSPQDIITIQECDIFIYVGGNSDNWIDGILETLDTEDITVLSLMDMVPAKEEQLVEGMEDDEHAGHGHGDEHSHDEGEPHSEDYDEHVWTSPLNAIRITNAIAEALAAKDAPNAAQYTANAAAYTAQLEELDGELRSAVQGGKRNTIVFGDRFPFRYLADEYGLQYYAAFPGCSSQTEPSAATVAFLIDKVKDEGIPVVFHIESSGQQMADTICAETGAKKLLLHSCHNLTRDELESGATYISLMRQNAAALREALQ